MKNRINLLILDYFELKAPTIFITLISDHFKLKALYGVAPGHQSLKHVFPTGGTHVAPSRNKT